MSKKNKNKKKKKNNNSNKKNIVTNNKVEKQEKVIEEKELIDKKEVEEKNEVPNDKKEETNVLNFEIVEQEELKDVVSDTFPKKTKHTFNKIKKNHIGMGISVLVVNLFIIFLIIMVINKFNDNVYKNVFLLENDFSGKTSDEVIQTLNGINDDIIKNRKIDVYQNTDNIYSIRSQDIEFELDVASTAKEIMGYGRDSNFILNNIKILKTLVLKQAITPIYKQNDEKIEEVLKNIDLSLKDRFVDDSYSLDVQKNELVITRGKSGNSIDYAVEKNNIINSFSSNLNSVNMNAISHEPKKLDLNKVHKEVKKDAKDAYIDKTTTPAKFVNEQVGYDFDVNELEMLLEKEENQLDGKVINFRLNVIEPKIKMADINYTLYKDKIAGYTTYFDTGSPARVNNLAIALNYLNGKIIMPGETFSYNNAIGNTTTAKGYQAAATFKAGTVVMELGGGICQTTSTLYNVALMANLEIVERHAHGLPVGYVPPSRDATVYSPVLDFKFKNTRNYPIKIITSFSYGGNLNISIYGTKEETEYEIILGSKLTGTVPFTTKYVYDNTLVQGEQRVVSAGVNGYTSIGYITKKLNGNVVSSAELSRDSYNAQQQVVNVGTLQ